MMADDIRELTEEDLTRACRRYGEEIIVYGREEDREVFGLLVAEVERRRIL